MIRTDRTDGGRLLGESQANMRTGLQKTGNRITGQPGVSMNPLTRMLTSKELTCLCEEATRKPRSLHRQFMLMILCAMENAENNDCVALYPEKEFVRKTAGKRAAESAVVKRELFRAGFEPQQTFCYCRKKFIAQSSALGLVPVARQDKVRPGLGADGDTPLHRLDCRTCRSTSRQGSPGFRSRSNSASAASRACRSAGVGSSLLMRSASCSSARRAKS